MAIKKLGKTRKTAKRAVGRATTKRKPATRTPAAAVVSAATRVPRRAIFIDVENTSSEDALGEVLEALQIDRAVQPTELTAVGNWRAVGQRLARHLA